MMRIRNWILVLSGGLMLALLSSAKAGSASATYSEIMGCEQSCEVAAGGWPVPYLVDYPGISVVGSVDLMGGLLGEDHFRPREFCLTMAVLDSVIGGYPSSVAGICAHAEGVKPSFRTSPSAS